MTQERLIKKIEVDCKIHSPTILAKAVVNFSNGLEVRGFRIGKSKFGDKPWVQPPSVKNKNDKWSHIIRMDKKLWEEIENAIISEYKKIAKDEEDKDIIDNITF